MARHRKFSLEFRRLVVTFWRNGWGGVRWHASRAYRAVSSASGSTINGTTHKTNLTKYELPSMALWLQ